MLFYHSPIYHYLCYKTDNLFCLLFFNLELLSGKVW